MRDNRHNPRWRYRQLVQATTIGVLLAAKYGSRSIDGRRTLTVTCQLKYPCGGTLIWAGRGATFTALSERSSLCGAGSGCRLRLRRTGSWYLSQLRALSTPFDECLNCGCRQPPGSSGAVGSFLLNELFNASSTFPA